MKFPFPTTVICEGGVEVTVPRLEAFVEKPSDYAPSKAPVFYNPVMSLNRDLAVLALQAFQRGVRRDLTVCTPFGGCGIRAVRFAKEVGGLRKIVVNDIDSCACQLAEFNVEKNKFDGKVAVENKDANFLLSYFAAPSKRFDYVDVDPFGSPMPYVDSSLRALRSGGLVALTATDLAPLCGVHSKACIRKYGGRPLRTEYCHELATRLLAGALARSAAKYNVGVEVLFSHSSEHYVRLYATVEHGARKADASLQNMGYISHCFTCFHRELSMGMFQVHKEDCPECNSRMSASGPLWLGQIIDEAFVVSMEEEAKTKRLQNRNKVHRLLAMTKNEAKAPPTYYVVDRICDKLGLSVPPVKKVCAKLAKSGHRTTLTHFNSRGVKTDAASEEVRKVITQLHVDI